MSLRVWHLKCHVSFALCFRELKTRVQKKKLFSIRIIFLKMNDSSLISEK